ncbi:MAG TPA: nuclear transport factor 2 family protein [Candidatus Eisenbacteria bacterium]|nr:nuclear transport factor 2 family protein [Candidatus Eisenbacteria bacterium]
MRPLILVLAAVLATSCAQPSGTSSFSNLTVKGSIDSLWTRYATAADARDSTAFGELFTEDASIIFSSAPTVQGRASIQTFFGALYGPVDVTGLKITQEDLKISGNVAAQTGTFREDFIEQNRERTEYGRFALIVEKGEDGPWRIWRLVALMDSLSQ